MKYKIFLALGFAACLALPARAQYAVFPADAQISRPAENGIFYSLPQNGFHIILTIEETILERGIYSDYAEQLLKLPAIRENTTTYEIKKVKIRNTVFPDPEQVFCVQGNPLPALRLSSDGILQSVNMPGKRMGGDGFFPPFGEEPNNASRHRRSFPEFPEEDDRPDDSPRPETAPILGSAGNFTPVADLNISRRFDTVIVKRETDTLTIIEKILQPRVDEKSLSEQARKMADRILKIQADKADLLSGLQEVAYPEGTMEFMYRQMEKNERQYMDCFTGTVRKRTITCEFRLMPQKGKLTYYLAFFSPENGLERIEQTVDPAEFKDHTDLLVLELSLLPSIGKEALRYESSNTPIGKPSGFYYRIPQKVRAGILYNGTELGSGEVFVSQWGKTLKLPAKENYQLQLHPKSGGIRYFGPAGPESESAGTTPGHSGKKTSGKR